jgi:hypothetical protein
MALSGRHDRPGLSLHVLRRCHMDWVASAIWKTWGITQTAMLISQPCIRSATFPPGGFYTMTSGAKSASVASPTLNR